MEILNDLNVMNFINQITTKLKVKLVDQECGFTLFEVLIAMTVGTVLLGLVLSIYSLSLRSLSASENRSELTQNSRVIIERLTRDIRQTRQIATPLPAAAGEASPAPPKELELQDGHVIDKIQYIRYYVTGTDLKRQVKEYYFPAEPLVLVTFDAVDDFGNPAQTRIIEDLLVGQYVSDLEFYGHNPVTAELYLQKSNNTHTTRTTLYGRNL